MRLTLSRSPFPGSGNSIGSLISHASVSFRESSDSQSVMAFFNLPGLTKQDVHVSFQRNRLVVSWMEVEVMEREEQGVIVQERRERKCNRTIALPEGTKVGLLHMA